MQIACCEFIALCNSCWNIYCSRTITHPARHHSVYKTLQPAYRLTATLYVTSLSVWVLCKCKCVSLYPHSTRMYVVICEQFAVFPACIYSTVTASRTSSVAAGFGRHGMPPPASNPDLWPFDLETGMRVASKVGNLPSKFGHARPLDSRIIRYVRDGRTDKSSAYCTFPYWGGGITSHVLAACYVHV